MVYIPCLAFLLLGHVLRPSWDLEKKNFLLEHALHPSWDLEKKKFCWSMIFVLLGT